MPQPGGSGAPSLVQRGHPHHRPPLHLPARRGQLSYAGLTASVCCVLGICLDSPALLSQQLNNRWLKKASIQSGLDQNITPRKVHKLQTKHTDRPPARTHTCKLHGLSELHMLQMRKRQIRFCLLHTVISLPTETYAKTQRQGTCNNMQVNALAGYIEQLPERIQ